MKVKLFERTATPHIGGQALGYKKEVLISNEEALKFYLKKGLDIRIKKGDKYITADEYYSQEEKVEAVVNEGPKEEKTKKVSSEINTTVDFEELFNKHWKTQIKEVEKIESKTILKKALEYAENIEASDSVLEAIKKQLQVIDS
jgi:vacuolar-type H+-ATPase subunit I/STV1